jgi:Transposase DDE domain
MAKACSRFPAAERRTLKITTVAAGLAFPHAAQAVWIVRRRRPLSGKNSKKWSTGTVYAVTSLTVTQAHPDQLAGILRGHWLIENRLHWIRDVTYDEDRSQVRAATAPASWPACATWPSPSCG